MVILWTQSITLPSILAFSVLVDFYIKEKKSKELQTGSQELAEQSVVLQSLKIEELLEGIALDKMLCLNNTLGMNIKALSSISNNPQLIDVGWSFLVAF